MEEALEQIWYARAVATLNALRQSLTGDTLRIALEQDTGAESLAVALADYATFAASKAQQEELERLLDLARAKHALLERAYGTVGVDEARALLGGISRQAVDKRRERGGLLALRHGGEYRYPLCQFQDGDVLPGLPEVLRAFTVQHSWTQLSVLVSEHEALDGLTMIAALQKGLVAEALDVAAAFGVTGA